MGDCMLRLLKCKASRALIDQAITLLKELLGLNINGSILAQLQMRMKTDVKISELSLEIYDCAVYAYKTYGWVIQLLSYTSQKRIEIGNYALSLCCSLFLIHTCSADQRNPPAEFEVYMIENIVNSVDVEGCSSIVRLLLVNLRCVCSSLSHAHNAAGNFTTSLQYAKISVRINLLLYGENTVHKNKEEDYRNIAVIYHKLDKFADALKNLEILLKLLTARHGAESGHGDIADCHYRIGKVQEDMGNYEEALKEHKIALKMRQDLYGEKSTHPNISCSCYHIAEIYRKMGNPTAANDYGHRYLDTFFYAPDTEEPLSEFDDEYRLPFVAHLESIGENPVWLAILSVDHIQGSTTVNSENSEEYCEGDDSDEKKDDDDGDDDGENGDNNKEGEDRNCYENNGDDEKNGDGDDGENGEDKDSDDEVGDKKDNDGENKNGNNTDGGNENIDHENSDENNDDKGSKEEKDENCDDKIGDDKEGNNQNGDDKDRDDNNNNQLGTGSMTT